MLFPGGLAEEVDEKILHSAFLPFGDITDINIPLDYETGVVFNVKHAEIYAVTVFSHYF